MYRGLLWVAWAVEECSRAYTRLSSRMGKLESRVDVLESAPRPTSRAAPPFPTATVDPAPPAPLAVELGKQAKDRIDGIEHRVRQLEYLSLKVANIQRSVDQLEKAPPPPAPAPTPPPAAEPEPVIGNDEAEVVDAELEAVYQELDRIAEFVAARVSPLERAVEQLRHGAASHGHDDADRRLAELEARLQRFERMFNAMQAGLHVAAR